MQSSVEATIAVSHYSVPSTYLSRDVAVDIYLPATIKSSDRLSLLLINDGQDLAQMNFAEILGNLTASESISPLLCVGIHAGADRKQEYGTIGKPDYAGRGAKAHLYQDFIFEELLPLIHKETGITHFEQQAIAGFSLGGLSALDTVWAHPQTFSIAGLFSGSLWWRSHPLGDGYDDDQHRIMQTTIRNGLHQSGLRFYFTTGSLDETADRNNNGIIDSIDDTMAVVDELRKKGYAQPQELLHINYEDGRHDVATWGRAFPQFLLWGWGK